MQKKSFLVWKIIVVSSLTLLILLGQFSAGAISPTPTRRSTVTFEYYAITGIADLVTKNSVVLHWSTVIRQGSGTPSSAVYYRKLGAATWSHSPIMPGFGSFSYSATNLISNTTYEYFAFPSGATKTFKTLVR